MECSERVVPLAPFLNFNPTADLASNAWSGQVFYKCKCHVRACKEWAVKSRGAENINSPAETPELVQIFPSTTHRAFGTHVIVLFVTAYSVWSVRN